MRPSRSPALRPYAAAAGLKPLAGVLALPLLLFGQPAPAGPVQLTPAQAQAPEGPQTEPRRRFSGGGVQPDVTGARVLAQVPSGQGPSWQDRLETARRDDRRRQCMAGVEASYQACLASPWAGGCGIQRSGGVLACNAGYNQPLPPLGSASAASTASAAPAAESSGNAALEARVRELEATLAQREAAASGASPAASDAIDCKVFDIRSNGAAQQRLRITANGRTIGSYQGSAGPYLTSLLRPGVNTVAFTYDSPGDGNTLLQVYCIPPDAEDRVEIRRFTPEAGRLEERVTVNMTRP